MQRLPRARCRRRRRAMLIKRDSWQPQARPIQPTKQRDARMQSVHASDLASKRWCQAKHSDRLVTAIQTGIAADATCYTSAITSQQAERLDRMPAFFVETMSQAEADEIWKARGRRSEDFQEFLD